MRKKKKFLPYYIYTHINTASVPRHPYTALHKQDLRKSVKNIYVSSNCWIHKIPKYHKLIIYRVFIAIFLTVLLQAKDAFQQRFAKMLTWCFFSTFLRIFKPQKCAFISKPWKLSVKFLTELFTSTKHFYFGRNVIFLHWRQQFRVI